MKTLKFVVPSEPIAQPRQKHRIISPKAEDKRPFVHVYVPESHRVHKFKAMVALSARQLIGSDKFTGPVSVYLKFVMPRPKHKLRKTKPNPRYAHTGKPDIDNLQKSVFDALNQIAWDDDSQVAEVVATKTVAAGNEKSHLTIEIKEFQLCEVNETNELRLPF